MIVYNKEKTKILSEDEYTNRKGYLDYDELNGERVIVYYPFDENQLLEQKLEALRSKREVECFTIVNRGQLWYNSLTDEQINELNTWYQAWLDVTETLKEPEKPEWIK